MRNYGYPSVMANQPLGEAPRLQPTAKTIPFDYVFQFDLLGEPRNKVQDVVEISMEGIFVALSVGYSLVGDEQKAQRIFKPVLDERTAPQSPTLVPLFRRGPGPNPRVPGPLAALTGFRVTAMPEAEISVLNLTGTPPVIGNPVRVNLNGTVVVRFNEILIESEGNIPVLRVWDRTNNLLSQPFELGVPSTPMINPDLTTRKLPTAGDKFITVYGSPQNNPNSPDKKIRIFLLKNSTGQAVDKGAFDLSEPFVPPIFDPSPGPIDPNPSLLQLPGFPLSAEARVRVPLEEALSPGDMLLVKTEEPNSAGTRPFSLFTVPRPGVSTITLGALASGLERIGAELTGGFRLSPNAANLVGANIPLDQLAPGTLERAFQTGSAAAEEVSFLYSLDITGSGREYQNKPIHNIAGLGIANGDRPFRPFARPVMFEPRSSVRIQVEEISRTPGKLYIVLQGYKMLGTGRVPGQ